MTDQNEAQTTTQQENAEELAELLSLLEAVDRYVTPSHVAQRFREVLGKIQADRLPASQNAG